jgi:hypothetical protein
VKLVKADVVLLLLLRWGARFAGQAQLETFLLYRYQWFQFAVPGLLQALALSGFGSNCCSFGPH